MSLKSLLKGLIKSKHVGESTVVKFPISSEDYFQKERHKTFVLSGNKNNSIESDTVEVKHEKNNEYDKNALAVYVYSLKIGYIFKSDQEIFKSYKQIQKLSVRQYYYKKKYRAELIVEYN